MPRCRARSGRELKFSATVEGPLQDAAALVSTFSVDGRELDLAGWADVLPDEWPAPETGHGSVEVRGVLQGPGAGAAGGGCRSCRGSSAAPPHVGRRRCPTRNRRSSTRATATQRKRAARRPAGDRSGRGSPRRAQPQMLSYPRLAFGLRAQKVGDTWRATVSNLNMARPTAAWLAARIEAQWTRTADGRMKASGKTDRVVLDALWPLLAYLPESEAVARLRALNATGTLSDLSFEFERDSADERAEVFAADSRRRPGFRAGAARAGRRRLERRSADDAGGRRAEARFARCVSSSCRACFASRSPRRKWRQRCVGASRARHGRSSPATFA